MQHCHDGMHMHMFDESAEAICRFHLPGGTARQNTPILNSAVKAEPLIEPLADPTRHMSVSGCLQQQTSSNVQPLSNNDHTSFPAAILCQKHRQNRNRLPTPRRRHVLEAGAKIAGAVASHNSHIKQGSLH